MLNEKAWQERFELHVDKSGKSWIWSNCLDCNIAIRQTTLNDAYKAAMMSLAHFAVMYKADRDELRGQLEILRLANERVFGGDDEDA